MIEVRPIAAAEVRDFRATVLQTFGIDLPADEDALTRGDQSFAALVDLHRTAAAFDGEQMVAASATFDLDLAVPGSVVPTGGLTMVAVKPSHRRQGLMRRFVDAHVDGCAERGQPLSGLWASEAPIYGRFGYGPACDSVRVEIDADRLELRDEPGGDALEVYGDAAASNEAREAAVEIYERVWRSRPGMYDRTPAWWQQRIFNTDRPGDSSNRARMAVARRGGKNVGYVTYKQFQKLGELPAGKVAVIELIAVDATAEASLWRFLVNIDLFPAIEWWNAPADTIGHWLTEDSRRFTRTVTDSLWLRVNDVAAALSARQYSADGALTLSVAGHPDIFELVVDGGEGRCERTDAPAALVFEPGALGAIYLGGHDPALLWRAGRIRGDAGAAALARAMFSWPVAPWCAEVF